MFVRIARDAGEVDVVIVDPGDCTKLHCLLDDVDLAAASAALGDADLGVLAAPERAWLHVAALRRRARALVQTTSWDGEFDSMVRFAAVNGWLDATGEFLAAHVVVTALPATIPPSRR